MTPKSKRRKMTTLKLKKGDAYFINMPDVMRFDVGRELILIDTMERLKI